MAEVTDVPDRSRFEAEVDGARAGLLTYRLDEGTITMVHTEVDDAFEGQGVGSQLVKAALDQARDAGLSVRPQCPFVRAYIDDHPEYADLVTD